MSRPEFPQQALLTFGDAEKSPLSIRAKALVFVDPRSRQLREQARHDIDDEFELRAIAGAAYLARQRLA